MSAPLFSAPISLILNHQLFSPRGVPFTSSNNYTTSTPSSQSTHRTNLNPNTPSTNFDIALFIDPSPESTHYGLTLQMSALRNMDKQHNPDQIPEYRAHIYVPPHALLHYSCSMPTPHFAPSNPHEQHVSDLDRILKTFHIPLNAPWTALRHLRILASNAEVDCPPIPKLRNPGLESTLRRIVGTVKTANEISEACLEIDCLMPALEGATDRAILAFGEAAQLDLDQRAAKKAMILGLDCTVQGSFPTHDASEVQRAREEKAVARDGNGDVDIELDEHQPKKMLLPAIIDGKFISPDKSPFRRCEKLLVGRGNGMGNGGRESVRRTLESSPGRYMHPHSFDGKENPFGVEMEEGDGVGSGSWGEEGKGGSQRDNWRADTRGT